MGSLLAGWRLSVSVNSGLYTVQQVPFIFTMATPDMPTTPNEATPQDGPKPPDTWDKLNTRIPVLNSLAQFVLVTLLGFFAKCSIDDYTHNMERTKRVDDLTTSLSTQETDKDITKRNLALVTLDRLYSNPKPKVWQWQRYFSDDESRADDSLMFNIAEEVYRARMATPVAGDTTQGRARLNLAARIMNRRDTARGNALVRSFKAAAVGKTRSSANAANTVSPQLPAKLLIASGNEALLKTPIDEGVAYGADAKATCFIQFRELTRTTAQKLQQEFLQQGWNAPGVERVAGSYGCSVRYFFAADEGTAKKALARTQTFMQSQPGSPSVTLMSLENRKLEGKVPHGQIEVWLSLTPGK